MMLVLLYGDLGKRFGRVHRYAVRTPAEAIRALSATVPGFRTHLATHSDTGYRVITDAGDRTLEDLAQPMGGRSIRIVPVIAGAGRGAGSIILGAALIAFSVMNPGFGAIALGGFSTSIASMAGSMGMSLLLGGVSQMLASSESTQSQSNERPENKPSYVFDGAVNTATQGNPVPVCYGRLEVGSQVISAGLFTEQIA